MPHFTRALTIRERQKQAFSGFWRWANLRAGGDIDQRYRIEAAAGPGMAAKQAPSRHHGAEHHSVAIDRFHGVFRAGGNIAAGGGKQRRNHVLVCSNQSYQCVLRNVSDPQLSAFSSLASTAPGTACSEFPERFSNYFQSLSHFTAHFSKVRIEKRPLRVHDYVHVEGALQAA